MSMSTLREKNKDLKKMGKSKELQIGRAGEHLVMADLLLNGIQAYTTGQGVNYDIVADCEGRLIRLQVKTTQKMRILNKHANPIYFFNIKRTGKKGNKYYQIGDFEGFALVALDRKAVFYLAFDGKIGNNSICIRDRKNDYSGRKGAGRPSGIYLQDLTWGNMVRK